MENEILNIPGVEDAAVVGIPDELYGEVPVAVVKLGKDSLLTEEEIRKILKNKIAGFKIPQKIIKVDSIPVTENMKTDKKYIRQLLVSFSSTAKDYYIDAAYFKTVATNLSSPVSYTHLDVYKRQLIYHFF